ncbi:acyl carrier protein [Streptomyces marincola]|uniref:Carrier domain-containing protein n=1 Tax=Streptomyces marincola TaxID=2878388 RepID=A0A1W7CVR4_9ACTN|nr:acyl carrier protein [Streptomyces marincola]ARQ68827.1 hypothetical protein CAG99_08085 [Streptomyces marincola]
MTIGEAEQVTVEPTGDTVREWLRERVATHTGREPSGIADDVPLHRYGFDSLYAVTLCLEVEERFALPIEPTSVWDHPTVTRLTAFIEGQLAGA